MKVRGNEIDISEFGKDNILQYLKKECENIDFDNGEKKFSKNSFFN